MQFDTSFVNLGAVGRVRILSSALEWLFASKLAPTADAWKQAFD